MQKQFIYKISSALMIVMLALFALPIQAAQARPLAAPNACTASVTAWRSFTSGNWNATGTWECQIGGVWYTSTTGTPSGATNIPITIQNTHTVTVTVSTNANTITIDAGGQVTINNGITWTISNGTAVTDLIVNGTVRNAGTVTPTGAIAFNNGGLYQHNFTTAPGTIPTATWNTGSTVAVIGYTSNTGNLAGFAGQTFYNFTWNSTSQAGAIAIGTGNYTTNINGNFTIASTGSGVLHLRKTGAAAVPVINITGDLIVQAGIFDLMNDGGAGNQVSTMNIAGNFNMTGGTVQTNTTQTGSYGVMNFTGANKTFTQSSGTFNGGTSRININVNNGASLTMNNNIPTLTGYGVTVVEGGTLNTGTNIVSGTGTFTVSNTAPGGTLGIGSLLGITSSGATGNIQTSTRTFNTGANYTYNGSGAQATGNGLPATVRNLTVNNSAGVSLTNSVTVSNALNFSSGRITTGANTIILPVAATVGTPGAGNYAFGNVQRAFTGAATSFTFPIGDATNYAPVALTFGSVTTPGTVTASVTNAACGAPGIDSSKNVNHCWTLTNNLTAPTNYTATFNFAGVGTDADAGATFGNFIVGKNDSGTWTYPTVGTKSATSTQATGMTTMSNFEVGEPASTAPTVTTPTSASISTTGATLGGNITSNGGGTITARGTCWATTATPRTNCVAEGSTATGVFTQARTGFTAGQTYYYAAYATNSAGIGYSADGTFTADSILTVTGPASTTFPATGTLTASGGLSGGTLTFNYVSGGCSIGGTTLTITNASSTPCVVNVTRAAGGVYLAQTSANFNAAMVQAPASATVTNSPQNYTGSEQSAQVTTCTGGGAASSILTGGAATQTNAGTYAVTANCAASNNYAAGTAVAAGNFTIDPATPTASITNTPVTYNGLAQTATVACLGGGTATLASGGTGTDAGSYPATVNCAASANYAAASGLVPTNNPFVINPATPTASITNTPVTYNGLTQTATVACLGGGTATLASGGTGTDAGSYPATVNCAASANYAAASGLVPTNNPFVINPATPTASITNTPVTYNGSAQTATVACLGGGAATLASGGTGTDAGSYPATVNCAASTDYVAASGLVPTNNPFVINQATQIITFDLGTLPAKTYGDAAFSVSTPYASADSGLAVTFTSTTPGICSVTSGGMVSIVNAGTCWLDADQGGNGNYSAAATVSRSFNIDKASSTVTVTGTTTFTYNGLPQGPASSIVTGSNGSVTYSYVGTGSTSYGASATRPTNAGTYSVTATVAEVPNYYGASSSPATAFTINTATLTVTATGINKVYDGTTTATVTLNDDHIGSDVVTVGYTSASFDNADVGPGKSVHVVGISITGGAEAGNYTLGNTTADTTANILADGTITAITTVSLDPTITGQAYAVNFTVTPITGGTPTGNVTVSDGTDSCIGTVALGTCNLTSTTTGAKTLTATYAGDSNFGGSVSAGVSHTVNEAPAITSADHTTFSVSSPGSFTIQTTGYPVPAISETGALPAWLSFIDNSDGTATFSGTPPIGSSGSYSFTLTAANGIGTDATQAFTLFVVGGPVVPTNGVEYNASGNQLAEYMPVNAGVNKLIVTFSKGVVNVPSSDPNFGASVINPANYMLLNDNGNGFEDTPPITCNNFQEGHPNEGDDFKINIDSVSYSDGTPPGSGPFVATLNVNGGNPLANGFYRLYVCGTTSITDLAGLELAGDGRTEGTDFTRNFRVSISSGGGGNSSGGGGNDRDGKGKNSGNTPQILTTSGLLIPVTGFAPNQVTFLPIQPADKVYKPSNEIRIEIPTLGINFPIVGVSFIKNNWDLTWLNGKVGYLEGSAYPTFSGNTVLTAHVTEPNNNLGPFSDIKGMQTGQKIYLHAYGQVYVYQVQENRKIKPTDISTVFKHEEYDWVTLVTCENYNAKTKTYDYRRMVRAVLISVIPEK